MPDAKEVSTPEEADTEEADAEETDAEKADAEEEESLDTISVRSIQERGDRLARLNEQIKRHRLTLEEKDQRNIMKSETAARELPKGSLPRVAIVRVTPSLAEEWLERNRHNRQLRRGPVGRYRDAMKEGVWMLSTDAIGFDREGSLVNGQHRLSALVESSEAQLFLVATGLDPEVFSELDSGQARQAYDALHIEGYTHVRNLASVLSRCVQMIEGRLRGKRHRVRNDKVLALARRFGPPGDNPAETFVKRAKSEYGASMAGISRFSELVSPSFVAFFEDKKRANDFLKRVAIGVGVVEETDPAHVLRQILLRRNRGRSRINLALERALTIKALNAFMAGKKVTKITHPTGEVFPKIDARKHFPFESAEPEEEDPEEDPEEEED